MVSSSILIRNLNKIKKNGNSLSIFPILCSEWDYDKNYPLRPEQFSYGSDVKVWWKCKDNHSWPSSIKNRVHNRNCPYCKNKGEQITIAILRQIFCPNCELKNNCQDNFCHKSFKDLKKIKIDGYCNKLKLCIEYNGIQHYEQSPMFHQSRTLKQQQERDLKLRNYCIENNLKLLIIDDLNYNNFQERVDETIRQLNKLGFNINKDIKIDQNLCITKNEEQMNRLLIVMKESGYTFQRGFEDYHYICNIDTLQLLCSNNHLYICRYNNFVNNKKRCRKCSGIRHQGKNNSNAKSVICLETKEIFNTLTEAAKKYKVSISNICLCCNDENRVCQNYHWMYYSDYQKTN